MKLLILNGPNLNLLGQRQPDVYGHTTLAQIEEGLRETFRKLDLVFLQSNHEGELIDAIQDASRQGIQGIVFNPGGYTHTSIALRDAVDAASIPVIEVHLSNIYGREEFRRRSLLAPVCAGQITGLGGAGYELAIRYLLQRGT
jgi:3-dehydroquinate dehydratase II